MELVTQGLRIVLQQILGGLQVPGGDALEALLTETHSLRLRGEFFVLPPIAVVAQK